MEASQRSAGTSTMQSTWLRTFCQNSPALLALGSTAPTPMMATASSGGTVSNWREADAATGTALGRVWPMGAAGGSTARGSGMASTFAGAAAGAGLGAGALPMREERYSATLPSVGMSLSVSVSSRGN